MPVRAVLFDLDDTLYDHTFAAPSALAVLAVEYHGFARAGVEALAVAHHEILNLLHPRVVAGELSLHAARIERFRLLAQRFGQPVDEMAVHGMVDCYRGTYQREERLVPGSAELLHALRTAGLRLGIVSNSTRTEQTDKLERLGVLDCFDAVVVSGDHAINKPDRRLFDLARQALEVSTDAAVFIGDNWPVDVEGALGAGMRAVWFNRFGLTAPDSSVAQLRDFALPAAIDVLLGR